MFHAGKNRVMFKTIRTRSFDQGDRLTAILVSATLAVLVIFRFITRIAHPELQSFPDRSIGITVLSGIDSNLRTLWYCALVAGIVLQSVVSFLLVTGLSRKIWPSGGGQSRRAEQSVAFFLSLAAAFLALYGVIRNEPFILDMAWAFLGFTGLTCFLAFLRSRMKAAAYYRDQSVYLLSALLAFSLPFLFYTVSGVTVKVGVSFLAFFLLASAVFAAGFPLLFKLGGLSPDRIRSANLSAALILALIPVVLPLANEIQFAVRGLSSLPPGGLGRIFSGIAWVAAPVFWAIRVLRPGRFRTKKFTANILFPVLIAGFFLCSEADRTLTFKTFDLFHNGERMLVTQQFIGFGKIPFLDIIPTHGVMDFFGQSLYSWVNGYRGPEMFLWRWIPELAGILLLYFALNRFMAPFFSFLLVVATPVTFIFNDYYRIALVIPLLLDGVALKYGFRRFAWFWFAVVVLFFWRYDFGVIATIATLVLIPAMLPDGTLPAGLRNLFRRLIVPLLAMAAVFAISAGLYALALTMHGQRPGEWFAQFYYYFKSQAPTQSVNDLYSKVSVEFFLEYIVSPLVASVYAVHYLWHLAAGSGRFKGVRLILTWLALFSLVMTMRTVQRHTLAEGFNPVLSFFLACALPFQFGVVPARLRYLLFLSLMVVFALVNATIGKRVFVKINPASLVPREEFCGTFPTLERPSRITISDSSQFRNFSRFCEAYLEPGQTFFDFSNAPLLYVFANRPFPAHLIPNLYQACDPVEEFLVKRLDTCRSHGHLPFVLFRQNSMWDCIDGVPQPVRSYRVAEFIYRFYEPYGKVDNYEIWKEKERKTASTGSDGNVLHFRDGLPGGSADLTVLDQSPDSISLRAGERDPSLPDILNTGKGIVTGAGGEYKLILDLRSDRAGTFQVFFSVNGAPYGEGMSSSFTVAGTGSRERHLVAIPKMTKGSVISAMRFDPPSGATMVLYPPVLTDSPFQLMEKPEPQHFEMGELPYVWARFDPRRACETTAVISTPAGSGSLNGEGDKLSIAIDPAIDRSSGNYLQLFIRSKEKGEATVAVGSGVRSTVKFALHPGEGTTEYLVRISVLRSWMSDPVGPIILRSTVPCEIEKILIRKGD